MAVQVGTVHTPRQALSTSAVNLQAEHLPSAVWFELLYNSHFFVQLLGRKPQAGGAVGQLLLTQAVLQWHRCDGAQPSPKPSPTAPRVLLHLLWHAETGLWPELGWLYRCTLPAPSQVVLSPHFALWHPGRGGLVLHEHLLFILWPHQAGARFPLQLDGAERQL